MVYVDTSVWVDLLTPELAPGTGAARVDDFEQGCTALPMPYLEDSGCGTCRCNGQR